MQGKRKKEKVKNEFSNSASHFYLLPFTFLLFTEAGADARQKEKGKSQK
jgi:hypothetical protein